jgi:hypothetical protein
VARSFELNEGGQSTTPKITEFAACIFLQVSKKWEVEGFAPVENYRLATGGFALPGAGRRC